MSIDWITVAAQMANFLVLVWLLKRFLYQPILDGIDAREEEIARRMAEAGVAQSKAQAAEAEYQNQQNQLLSNRDAMVEQALKASASQRDSLLADAQVKLEQEQQDWHRHLERERHRFTTQLHQAGAETLLELTRRALHDLADETLEDAIVRHIIARLRLIAAELFQAAGDITEATATTHGNLSIAVQKQMQADIQNLLPGIALRFETDAQQAPGLILRVGGAQVAWTIDSYTDELDALLNERLAVSSTSRV